MQFVARWRDATSERSERQSFWNDFFRIFGVERRQVAAFERLAQRSSTGGRGWIDLLWPGQMGVEHKSRGEELSGAMDQLLDYLPSLTSAEHPWLLIACDFARFRWQNLETDEAGEFGITELPDNLDLFYWIAGYDRPHDRFEDSEEANLFATSLLAAVHDHLKKQGYPDEDLGEWLTRILFMLFADDTGVWDRALFHSQLALTKPDGSDLGNTIALIFQVLDTPPDRRQSNLDDDLTQFTYVNGDLFKRRLSIPICDSETRHALLYASTFNWARISPAIFGSLFQNVTESIERRRLGAHYTTEENILRTIRPLFLSSLEAELASADTRPKLRAFLSRLSSLKFFDPACGCGNFLVVTYRELRRLETKALRRLRERERRTGQYSIDITLELKVRIDQFYGIEIEEFPARIARTALYLADHLANREASAEFGQHYVRFPIPAAAHIAIDNALRVDWATILDPNLCNFIFGNPPYSGKHLLSGDQRDDVTHVFSGYRLSGSLDHVAAWFRLAADYIAINPSIVGAFVSTNSVTQGEQVPALWPLLHEHGLHIMFGWPTFEWQSEAKSAAHVHVVIIGFRHAAGAGKGRLYEARNGEIIVTEASSINGYLIDCPEIYVRSRVTPIAPVNPVVYGSKPADGGFLLLSEEEAESIRRSDAIASKYIRPLYSDREFVNGRKRFCLWLVEAEVSDLRKSTELRRRLQKVVEFRSASTKLKTRDAAATPALFAEIRLPTGAFIFIPVHVSGQRSLIPMGLVAEKEQAVVHNSGAFIEGGGLLLFGVLQSAWFTAWQACVGGRIKSDFRFNNRLVYNTFPFPDASESARVRIEVAARGVLDVRDIHGGESLADLYDPLATPADLVSAHRVLDRAVDLAFNARRRFATDTDRLQFLFGRYAELAVEGQLPVNRGTETRRVRRRMR